MAQTKGSIPMTGEIALNSISDQWKLFSVGMLPVFTTKGEIVLKDKTTKVIIDIQVVRIMPPNSVDFVNDCRTTTSYTQSVNEALSRVGVALQNYLCKKEKWVFLGIIRGNKRVPIVFEHYGILKKTFYSLVEDEEEIKKMFPAGIPDDVRKN